jgi:hypothetical protein
LSLHPSELSSFAVGGTVYPFNLADLQGPVPSTAYFRAPWEKDFETKPPNQIDQENYHPFIALPTQILEHEPAFASCWPFVRRDGTPRSKSGVVKAWDPPMGVDPTPLVKSATMTAYSKAVLGTSAIPVPGSSFTNPMGPSRTAVPQSGETLVFPPPGSPTTHQAHGNAGFGVMNSHGLAPTAVITIGKDKITASILDDPNKVQIDSAIVSVGGPPLTTAGLTLSFGENGRLNLGPRTAIYLAPKSGTSGSVDLSAASAESHNAKLGATVNDRQGGHISSDANDMLKGGTSVEFGSAFASNEVDEVSLIGGIDPMGEVLSLLGPMRPSATGTRDSGASRPSQGRSGRKKSAADGHIDLPTRTIQILCFMIGLWWSGYGL